MAIFAFVLLNCRFPFDKTITEKLGQLSAVTNIYRTSGVYDLILKVTADTEDQLHKVSNEISLIKNVGSAVTMMIA
jgi:DNA-binding Lrp family transcriptional regulator